MTRPTCDYGHLAPDSVTWVRCIALPTHYARVAGEHVPVCADHVDRVKVLVGLIDADTVDYRPCFDPFPDTAVSCPPNPHHGGTVTWTLSGTGNACPVCGRFA